MADQDRSEGNRAKSARYRDKLREQGLRPIQMSVPDTRRPDFTAEATRQARLVDGATDTVAALKFMSAIAAWR